jgi:hypothetical protein
VAASSGKVCGLPKPPVSFRSPRHQGSAASNGKLVAKLAESSNEQWWRVRSWWFQRVAPSASAFDGFALASAFAPVRPLRQNPEKASTFAASAPKQRQESGALESIAIHHAPCHNNAFNRTRGKLLAGFAGLGFGARRLRQTLAANKPSRVT